MNLNLITCNGINSYKFCKEFIATVHAPDIIIIRHGNFTVIGTKDKQREARLTLHAMRFKDEDVQDR